MNKWTIVALLWFCGFFNYADRQSLAAVKPILEKKMDLRKSDLGVLDSAFMVTYALCAPIAGWAVDRGSRKRLVVVGLAFWSFVAVATSWAKSYHQLVFVRAIEGLGEAFYFPASMSLLAAFHTGATRSRAMSFHQTSVYAGTALGGFIATILAARRGWQAPFALFGVLGMAYAGFLAFRLVEPAREKIERAEKGSTFGDVLGRRAAWPLLLAFAGANFTAMGLLQWMPYHVFKKFPNDVLGSAMIGNVVLPVANVVGVLIGGRLSDGWATKIVGGRVYPQAFALLVGVPFVVLAGRTDSQTTLVFALSAIGVCKGVYDASIFASIYDVVPARARGTAAGLMNMFAWIGAAPAPTLLGFVGDRVGLGIALAATAGAYAIAGSLLLLSPLLRRPLSGERVTG